MPTHQPRFRSSTREMHAGDIHRAALILGLIPDFSKGSIMRLRKQYLNPQLERGLTEKTGYGRYRSTIVMRDNGERRGAYSSAE